MWRASLSVSLVVLLTGCASMPRPQMHIAPKKAQSVQSVPAPVTVTPLGKPKWYDKFPRPHVKFFH